MNGVLKMDEDIDLNAHLTEEQWEQVRRATTGYGEQGANGYDLSMFRENLRLTPTERIQKMQRRVSIFSGGGACRRRTQTFKA